jgi:hypothetical protein
MGPSGSLGRRATVDVIVDRTDVVDIAPGLKFRLPGGFTGFASAIIPLTSDGIRANVVPTGGISYGF